MANAPGAAAQMPTMLASRPATAVAQRRRWLEVEGLLMATPFLFLLVGLIGETGHKVQCRPGRPFVCKPADTPGVPALTCAGRLPCARSGPPSAVGGSMDLEYTGLEAEVTSAGRIQAFLISDIRGYSTFTAQRGAAAAAHLASTFTNLSRDAIVARGGQVLGLRGDEVLAAFDSPVQAVRAAIDIQYACAEATAVEPAFPLGVGAGVDFGEAVAVDDGYHGAAINMAARLCSQATAGQVLVTATVANAAAGEADLAFETRATVELKGFDHPVEIFEAHSVRSVIGSPVTGPGRRGIEPSAPLPLELDEMTPLVGRDGELSWLRGIWRQAQRGHGRVVLLAGPAGIGKTRLAAEMARQVRSGGDGVLYTGGGGAVRGETLAAIGAARTSRRPGCGFSTT